MTTSTGTQLTSGTPKCPNHFCPLMSTGDKATGKRKMQCPVSNAIFEVEVETGEKEVMVDKFGNVMHRYKVSGGE